MRYLINVINKGVPDESFRILASLISRKLSERGISSGNGYSLIFDIDSDLTEGSYRIESDADSTSLTGADTAAVFAAFGRFLLESVFDGNGGFTPVRERIDFTPSKPLRGMYFATHFHNFYHNAPLESVYETVDDLAMYGCNCLMVWFDMHHYTSVCDPDAVLHIKRLHAILGHAALVGIGAALTMNANEGFASSPVELRASGKAQNGYHHKLEGYYNTEICPSVDGGIEEIIRERRSVLECFCDLPIKYVNYWPYDQGGCTCEKCVPWGINGFLKLFPAYRALVRELMPKAEIIMSTWYFDKFGPDEWSGFYRELERGIDGVSYVMSFFSSGKLPACIKEKGLPKGIRFIDFPEISMHYCIPWGGFGANPLSRYLDRTNAGSGDIYNGGFPYSEGIFEDVNKFCTLTHYSGLCADNSAAVRAYVRLNFCVDSQELTDAVIRTETALSRTERKENGVVYYDIADTSDIEYVYSVITKFNDILPEAIRKDRRWRIIYLRAVIDRELLHNDFAPVKSKICLSAFDELRGIYCVSDETIYDICPPRI